jgi:hypothetical protein
MDCLLALTEWKSFFKPIRLEKPYRLEKIGTAAGITTTDKARTIRSYLDYAQHDDYKWSLFGLSLSIIPSRKRITLWAYLAMSSS